MLTLQTATRYGIKLQISIYVVLYRKPILYSITPTGYTVLKLLLGVLVVLVVLLLAFLFVYYPGSLNVFNLYQSKSLPYPSKIFVGREQEMLDLSDFLDFSHSDSDIRIVNIVGSPGFGKSTLAIHVGNRLVQQGIDVHYVNLAEYQEQKVQQTLAEKILKVAGKSIKMVTFDELLVWLRRLFWNAVNYFRQL